jgi:CRP-like cAMP-binding protein
MLSRVEAFAKAPLFTGLSQEKIEELAAGALVLHLKAGEVLYRAGQAGTSVCVIQDGEVEVQMDGPRGTTLILALANPGSNVGELSVLDEGPRSATVVATKDTQVLSLPRTDILKLLHSDPDYMAAMLKVLAGMIRNTNTRLVELAILDRPSRMARAIRDLALRDGVDVHVGLTGHERHAILIDRDVTISELAALTALHPVEVEHVLRDLQLNDTIVKDGHRITVMNMAAIERAAELD